MYRLFLSELRTEFLSQSPRGMPRSLSWDDLSRPWPAYGTQGLSNIHTSSPRDILSSFISCPRDILSRFRIFCPRDTLSKFRISCPRVTPKPFVSGQNAHECVVNLGVDASPDLLMSVLRCCYDIATNCSFVSIAVCVELCIISQLDYY